VASTIAQVQEDTAKIRGEMGHMQRHQLRIIPELHFHLDETIDKMARIDELLKQ
jgi:ribosome-binding factor A